MAAGEPALICRGPILRQQGRIPVREGAGVPAETPHAIASGVAETSGAAAMDVLSPQTEARRGSARHPPPRLA